MLTARGILLLAITALVIGGCKKEEQKSPVIPTTQKGVTPVPTEKPSEPAPTEEPQVQSPEPQTQFTPADDKDEPQFALLFPTSDKAFGWTKTDPVKGGVIKRLPEYLPDLADVLSPYSAETIATVKYERAYNGGVESVRIYLIRAATTEDAYGMMSVSVSGTDQFRSGEIRRQPAPGQIYAVKGPYFAIFQGQTTAQDTQHLNEGVELLAGKVMFEFSDHAELPMVVQILQTEQLPAARTLFLRDLKSLKGPAGKEILETVGLTDLAAMNKLLRLGPKVDFALAVYTHDDWPAPDVVWLARYPSLGQSSAVAKHYRAIINRAKASDRLNNNTLLKGPSGRFLLGTWTLEIESIPHLMNQIQTYLPGGK